MRNLARYCKAPSFSPPWFPAARIRPRVSGARSTDRIHPMVGGSFARTPALAFAGQPVVTSNLAIVLLALYSWHLEPDRETRQSSSMSLSAGRLHLRVMPRLDW